MQCTIIEFTLVYWETICFLAIYYGLNCLNKCIAVHFVLVYPPRSGDLYNQVGECGKSAKILEIIKLWQSAMTYEMECNGQ